jgi:hypothetical protein
MSTITATVVDRTAIRLIIMTPTMRIKATRIARTRRA